MKRLKFASASVALLFVGWLVIGILWAQWHRYESVVPGWRYGHLSGAVFPSSDNTVRGTGFFMLAVKAHSKGAWYWQVPTNFSYAAFEIQTSRELNDRSDTNLISVTLPSLAFRSITSTGILSATELRRFLIADSARPESSPTVTDCEWLIHVLERAHSGSFPPPRHHGINEDELADSALRPPPAFGVSFQHFDLGMGFPWIIWVGVGIWALLVWIGARKWLAPRVSNSRPSNESGHVT